MKVDENETTIHCIDPCCLNGFATHIMHFLFCQVALLYVQWNLKDAATVTVMPASNPRNTISGFVKTAASWLYLITLIGLCDVQKEIKEKSMKILPSFYKVSCNHCIHVTKRIQCHLTRISLKNHVQSTPVTTNPYVTDLRLQNCSK